MARQKKSELRMIGRTVLEDRGYLTELRTGQGLLPGARLRAKKDGEAFDEYATVVQHQRWYPQEWIVGPDLLRIAEDRPRTMLEGDAVKPHGDAGATDERGIELADEDHGDVLRRARKLAWRSVPDKECWRHFLTGGVRSNAPRHHPKPVTRRTEFCIDAEWNMRSLRGND